MANGSIKIGGGSITIEFDKGFEHKADPNGHHRCNHREKNMKIREVVITDASGENAYLKFDAETLPPGKNFFIKVNYEAAKKSAAAGTRR